ncbi:MAG: M20/M25/M40 family metallo-hydrolase [Anaerolineae bacterium]|nr:M20/M25/M40 family metallo-hydrolase [Anaerolineae bacterium]
MPNALSAISLMHHARALAEEIGPRPAGHIEEMRARQYVRAVLAELGFAEIETLPFRTPDTWGYALGIPIALALATNVGQAFPSAPRRRRLIGGMLALASAYALWEAMRVNKQPLTILAPRRPSATLIARIPAGGETTHTDACNRVVLLAHLDTNKARLMFHPKLKKMILGATTAGWGAIVGNGLLQIADALWPGSVPPAGRKASIAALVTALALTLGDEYGNYVPGANDNASAVAVVLGLAAHLQAYPLKHTDVWLAFTGAEESGCVGAHALLDTYGDELRDAWFLDFEMVGTQEIAYVTRHSGFSYLSAYTPDAESLAWVKAVAQAHPEYNIHGRAMVIGEEVGALRSRGYRGICLAGYGPDGWLENWHQSSDDIDHLVPEGLEKTAHFAWDLLKTLDNESRT